MIVYADVLIFLNGIITYFLLLCICFVFGFRPKTYRLILGAVFGGFSALTIFLPSLNFFLDLLLRAVVCALTVLITFSFHNKIRFIKYSLAFLTVTYIFAGAVLAFCEIAKPDTVLVENSVAYFDISPVMLILLTACVYLFIRFLLLFRKNAVSEQNIYECIVEYSEVTVTFYAINDTGNSLSDPYFNSPVAVVDKDVLRPILQCSPKTYLIPIKSVLSNGTVWAFRPDGFYIVSKGKKQKISDITVAISENGVHSQYSALLSPTITDFTEEELCLAK